MNNNSLEHPSEEKLMEAALDGGVNGVKEHLSICPQCSQIVGEMQAIGKNIAGLNDEEIPEHLEKRILGITHGRASRNGLVSGIGSLISNPLVVALITAIVIVLLCVLVGSEILKAP